MSEPAPESTARACAIPPGAIFSAGITEDFTVVLLARSPFKLDLGIVLDEDLDVVIWQGIPDSVTEHREDPGRKFEAKGFTHL
jgi:hypothetical protein